MSSGSSSSHSNSGGSAHSDRSDASRRPVLPSITQVFPEHFRATPYPAQLQQPYHTAGAQYAQSPAAPAQHARQYSQTPAPSNQQQQYYAPGYAPAPGYSQPPAGGMARPPSTAPAPGYAAAGMARPMTATPAGPYEFGVHRVDPRGLHTLQTNQRDPIHFYKPEGQEKPKPHACPQCGTMFERPSAVQIHMRTHTGERPYQCPHCHKMYPSSTNLNRHIRQVHGEDAAGNNMGGSRPSRQ